MDEAMERLSQTITKYNAQTLTKLDRFLTDLEEIKALVKKQFGLPQQESFLENIQKIPCSNQTYNSTRISEVGFNQTPPHNVESPPEVAANATEDELINYQQTPKDPLAEVVDEQMDMALPPISVQTHSEIVPPAFITHDDTVSAIRSSSSKFGLDFIFFAPELKSFESLMTTDIFKDLGPPNPVLDHSLFTGLEAHGGTDFKPPPLDAVFAACSSGSRLRCLLLFLVPDLPYFPSERSASTTSMLSAGKITTNAASATSPPNPVFVFNPGSPHRDVFHSAVRLCQARHVFFGSPSIRDGTALGPSSGWPWVPWQICKGPLGFAGLSSLLLLGFAATLSWALLIFVVAMAHSTTAGQ